MWFVNYNIRAMTRRASDKSTPVIQKTALTRAASTSTKQDGNRDKPRKSNVSLKAVADVAGVSKMTASRVLRGVDGFSEETRAKVLRVAAELEYVPNKLAAAFGSDKASTLVGIAIPTLGRDLFAQMLEGIEGKLSAVGYQPIVGVVGYDDTAETEWLNSVLTWRPGGLILAGRKRGEALSHLIRRLDIPTIEIWNLDDNPNDVSVGFNHFDAGFEMGSYLVSRYSGQFGYVGAQMQGVSLGEARLDGFAAALTQHDNHKVPYTHLLNDRSSFYAGYYGTEQILSSHPDIRALYYLDDNMAVGGLMLCQSKGIKVPGDVAIAGFGGMDIASILPQRLTTTTAFRLRIGKLAAESLLKRLTGNAADKVQDVGFSLVKGETA